MRNVGMMGAMARLIIVATWVGVWCAGASAIDWSLVSVIGPEARSQHSMVYDSARDRVLLGFGRRQGNTSLGDLWSWNGSAWSPVPVVGPSPRAEAAMVYDAHRDRVVLFGGATAGGATNETWEFDGAAWSPILLPTLPPPRFAHAYAYDSLNRRVVIHGGVDSSGVSLDDTWAYDGASWQLLSASGPGARNAHSMVFDRQRNVMILFGGTRTPGGRQNDTWELDGSTWTQVSTTGSAPSPRELHRMAFDPVAGRTVLFGGITAGGVRNGETYAYDSASRQWQPIAVAGPSPRAAHAMCFDAGRGGVTLHGGRADTGLSAETWRMSFFDVFYGLEHRPIGQAQLEQGPAGELIVTNLVGPPGTDGVSVNVRGSQAFHTELTLDPAMPVGARVESRAFGSMGGVPGQYLGMVGMERTPSEVRALVDYGPSSPTFTVVIRQSGQDVWRESGLHTGDVGLPLGIGIKIDCSCNWSKLEWVWRVIVDLSGPSSYSFRIGPAMVPGDEIVFLPDEPLPASSGERVDMLVSGMPSMTIEGEACSVMGMPHTGLGDALMVMDAPARRLTVTRLGGGGGAGGGVRVPVGGFDAFGTDAVLSPDMPVGSFMRSESRGRAGGAEVDAGTIQMRCSSPGRFHALPDFGPIGSPTYTCNVYDGDELVRSVPGLTGEQCSFVISAATRVHCRCTWWKTTWTWTFGVSVDIDLSGTTIQGTTIEFLPDTDVVPVEMVAMNLVGGGMPEMVIHNEAVGKFEEYWWTLGDALLEPHPRRMLLPTLPPAFFQVRNIGSSGQDGVALVRQYDKATPKLARTTMNIMGYGDPSDPSNPVRDGAFVEVRTSRFGPPGSLPIETSSMRFADAGPDIAAEFDFGAVAPQCRATAECSGQLVDEATAPGPVVGARSNIWPDSITVTVDLWNAEVDLHLDWKSCASAALAGRPPVNTDVLSAFSVGSSASNARYHTVEVRSAGTDRLVFLDSMSLPDCYADCDKSTGPGALDIFDFLCFQNQFAAGSAAACDCDVSTGPGSCDIFDFLCFQNHFAEGCGPIPTRATFSQVNAVLDQGSQQNTPWGSMDLSYIGHRNYLYANVNVDGQWVVRNAPLMSTSGPDQVQTVTFNFPLNIPSGQNKQTAEVSWKVEEGVSLAPPPLDRFVTVGDRNVVVRSGEVGFQTILTPPQPLVAAAVTTPRYYGNDGLPNQDGVQLGGCVPAAFSNSLQFLKAKYSLTMPDNQISLGNMKNVCGFTPGGGCTFPDYVTAKDNYAQANNWGVTTTTTTDPAVAHEAMRDGCDVEMRVPGHIAAISGMVKLSSGNYGIWVKHDTMQGEAGGTKEELIIYNPTTQRCSGGWCFDGRGPATFIIECP